MQPNGVNAINKPRDSSCMNLDGGYWPASDRQIGSREIDDPPKSD
jgi:hypothetical protein